MRSGRLRRQQQTLIETSFVLTSHPDAALHLFSHDLSSSLFSFFVFTFAHSSLIESGSADRVHCVSSCCWQPQKDSLFYSMYLVTISHSIFASCFYTNTPFRVPWKVYLQGTFHCLLLSGNFYLVSFYHLFSTCWFTHFCGAIFLWNWLLQYFSPNTASLLT